MVRFKIAGRQRNVESYLLKATILLVTTVVACSSGEEAESTAQFVVRDSAGITIVTSESPAWASGFEWTIGPMITVVGEMEGAVEYQLFHALDATRLSDGTVAVANSGTSEIRFFDSNGRHIRTVGRSGGGPGEFSDKHGLRALGHWMGDTLYTWDLYAQTLSVFSPDGEFVRSNRLRNTNRMYFMSRMYGGGMFGDKTLALALIDPTGGADRSEGMQTRIVRYVRFSADGDSIVSLGDYEGAEWFIRFNPDGQGMRMTQPPFGREMTARAAFDRLFVATGKGYEIQVYRPDASLEMLIRKNHPAVAVTAEMRDWALEQQLAAVANHSANFQATLRRDYADMTMPEFLPPYRTIQVDENGNLWVREYLVGDDAPDLWSVFDSTGVWLGTVELPQGLEVFEIGDDYVLGRMEDELEVERIVIYSLMKSER